MNTNEVCIFSLPKEYANKNYVEHMTIYAIRASPIEISFVRNNRTKDTFNAIAKFGTNHQITDRLEWLLGYEIQGRIQAIHHHPDKEDQPIKNMWFDIRWADTPEKRALKRLKRENARLKRENAKLKNQGRVCQYR